MKLLKKIGEGNTADVFAIGDNKVLKLFHSDYPHASIEREYRIGLGINPLQLGPKMFQKVSYQGKIGIVYEYVDGKTMLQEIYRKPWRVFTYIKLFTKLQISLHQQSSHTLPTQKETVINKIFRAGLLTSQEKEILIVYTRKLKEESNLCHGDFHPENILISKRGPVIIDWTDCRRGNPAGDIARTLLLLQYAQPSEPLPLHQAFLSTIIRALLAALYKKEYKKLTNISQEEIKKWELPITAARLAEKIPAFEKNKLVTRIRQQLNVMPGMH